MPIIRRNSDALRRVAQERTVLLFEMLEQQKETLNQDNTSIEGEKIILTYNKSVLEEMKNPEIRRATDLIISDYGAKLNL